MNTEKKKKPKFDRFKEIMRTISVIAKYGMVLVAMFFIGTGFMYAFSPTFSTLSVDSESKCIIKTIIYDRNMKYTGELFSIEYQRGWFYVISDTTLWFRDGANFTISGQREFTLCLNYTIWYHETLTNVTRIYRGFPYPEWVSIRLESTFRLLNITVT